MTKAKLHTGDVTFRLLTNDPKSPIYLAGDFNQWLPNLQAFRLKKNGNRTFEVIVPGSAFASPTIDYKYTLGNWDLDERDSGGSSRPNRRLLTGKGLTEDVVPVWPELPATGSPWPEVFRTDFPMRPLRRKRRISVLLPHSYFTQTDKRYPVLYLLDGQNLSGHGSAYGNWQIDRRLEKLAEKGRAEVIVVMIDHGEKNRLPEFSPYAHPKIPRPRADHFLDALTNYLKPAIDSAYRTLPDRGHTGVGGSSMGGLFSAYAGLRRPDIFGKIMVFSPSLWIAAPLFDDIEAHFRPLPTRLYLYAGGREGVRTVSDLQQLHRLIRSKDPESKIRIHFSLDPRGKHQEDRWGAEFEKALPWLFSPSI